MDHGNQYCCPPVGETVNVRQSGAGSPVLFTLPRGAAVHAIDLGGGDYWYCTVLEPAQRAGYIDSDFLQTTQPSSSVALAYQMFSNSTLQYGSSGAFVKNLQGYLIASGYNIAKDGVFGPATEGAVEDFQSSHSLTVDGKVGLNTKNKLITIHGRLTE